MPLMLLSNPFGEFMCCTGLYSLVRSVWATCKCAYKHAVPTALYHGRYVVEREKGLADLRALQAPEKHREQPHRINHHWMRC